MDSAVLESVPRIEKVVAENKQLRLFGFLCLVIACTLYMAGAREGAIGFAIFGVVLEVISWVIIFFSRDEIEQWQFSSLCFHLPIFLQRTEEQNST